MPAARVAIRKVIEVLRLRLDQGLSHQAIARALGTAQGSVQGYLTRFAASGVGWPLSANLDTLLVTEHARV